MAAIGVAALPTLALLAAPSAAADGDVFRAGTYKGANGQDRPVEFAADPSGVHVFTTRLTMACRDGTTRTMRVWIPHIELSLDDIRGQFTYTRQRAPHDVVRVTGTLAGEIGTGTVSRRAGPCRSGTRTWTAGHTGASDHAHHSDPRLRRGNHAPYPPVDLATATNRRRARALRRATNAHAPRFATVARANALGYVANNGITPVRRPGIVHFRKNFTQFWGRVLDPREPQALIFWCPRAGRCSLVAFMYRAPPNSRPPTYGGLIGWHRHNVKNTWMTHVWLTGDVTSALAQCVPFDALTARNPRVAYGPYRPDIRGLDEPCPDTTGYVAAASQAGSS